MKALDFIFQDTEIHFLLGNDKNVMINATEMAKVFGKRTDHFLQNESTKSFISKIKVPEMSGTLGINNEKDLVDNQGRNGIYFHRILALKFAAWLDADFEIWVYSKIEEVLFGKAKTVALKIQDAEQKKLDIAILTDKVKSLGNQDVNLLLQKIDELKKIEADKKKAMRQFSNQYKMF